MAYARIALRLTRSDAGVGRYGASWGVWRYARLAPGTGYYQPDFQCAEYVMRALRAARLGIATPPPSAANWPELVNVDRALAYLEARGLAHPAPLRSLSPGDLVFFRFLRLSPNRFGHVALVVGQGPLRLAAHNRDRWAVPLSAFRGAMSVTGLAISSRPRPASGLVPLPRPAWGEVALRDPPLRAAPGGALITRLYLGQVVRLRRAVRARGSYTGWLKAQSGSLSGWVNGDAVTRLPDALPSVRAGTKVVLPERKVQVVTLPAAAAIRGDWGHKRYVSALGRPVPDWTARARAAPYATLGTADFPTWTAVAKTSVLLTLSPSVASLAVLRQPKGVPAAAERLGKWAVLFRPGGPSQMGGAVYAKSSDFYWQPGGVALVTGQARIAGAVLPAQSAFAVARGRLWFPGGTIPLPHSLPLEVTLLPAHRLPSLSALAAWTVLAAPSWVAAPPGLPPTDFRTPMLLASRTTTYVGSAADRNHNLAVGAQFFDKKVLAPGERLSFNDTLGPTTQARGFKYGPVFYGNRVGRDLGGGVCQIASTLYVAARGANLQILERHQHGLRVPYLPGGEDATVASGYLDLKIRNDTGGPIELRAKGQGPSVTVAIYGTRLPPRTWFYHRTLSETGVPVERVADPALAVGTTRVVAHGSAGLTVHTWFAVRGPGTTTTVSDLGVDHYRASPKVVHVGQGR